MSEIKKGTNKFFFGEKEQTPDAEIVFRKVDNTLVIEHTYVSEDLRGQGVGGRLVDETVQFARDENYKIESQCAYAASVLENNHQYRDILK
ncbi:GNAT family N-acetyltransferase [Bacillus sp. AK031]